MRRFSIRTLMAVIVVCAVGMAALMNANSLWAGMMLLASLAAVGIAMMGAVILRGGEQYWWAGFAFFGGAYLALAFAPWLSDTFQPQLGTTRLLSFIHAQTQPPMHETLVDLATLNFERKRVVADIEQTRRVAGTKNDPSLLAMQKKLADLDARIDRFQYMATVNHFQRVGHALFALLSGLLGGTAAAWFYARRERAEVAAM